MTRFPRRRRILIPLAAVALILSACTGPTSGPDRPPASKSSAGTPQPTEPTPTARPSGRSRAAANRDLIRATRSGDLDSVRKALAEGADPDARSQADRPVLLIATRANRVAIVRALLEAGADPDAEDSIRDSAFLYAGAEGLDEILKLTLEHGADVKSINRYGGTALIPAGEHAQLETIRILIDAGVPVNHVNNLGWTALHEAIVLGTGSDRYVEAVRMLLAAGADPSLPDGNGRLPRQLAADRGFDKIATEIDRHH
ncbi:hypothetical protein FOE78_09205 [Microlunatus elymi]|uniref:Uncharacterized protein n=1 Tax=Microlunatus elymi TaxID=2596828 RepID=A0A516PYK1_9ACTN|nr:ankyrin repeat domain-containing protein [Microlunatus elymi]QDP96051.1 hypothetical protein FOE78_09205 [Microlunatus elymi]